MPLYPTDGKPNGLGKGRFSGHSGRGIVRNFVLRTSGTKPGDGRYRHDQAFLLGGPQQAAQNAFYGANVLMFLRLGDVPGQTLTLKFTPLTRTLADGCRAKGFSRSVTLGQFGGGENFFFQNIPLAFYRLTATLDGKTVLLALDGQDTTTSSVPFRPVPNDLFGDGSAAVNVAASFTSSPYGE